MRIHLIGTEFDVLSGPGGPGWSGRSLQIKGLAAALADDGHEVTVVCHPGLGPAAQQLPSGPVVEHVPDSPGALRDHLGRRWRENPPDVAHALDGPAGVAAADAAGAAGVALVQSLTAVNGPGADGRDPAAQDVLLRRAERIVAGSDAQTDSLLRRGAPRSRVRVVPPGVDAEQWVPDGHALRRGEQPRVVVVGSLEPGSGVEDAIAALRQAPETEMFVAGGPEPGREGDPDLTRLQELAARCGVARRVRFLGAVRHRDVGPLMRSADVVVCPSRDGGCGATVLEAMACGRPVVATAAGCQRDIVVDGVTGLLVRPGQPAELGSAMRNVLADPTSGQAFGIAGRDRVLARYSWARIAETALAAYGEAVRELHPVVVEPVVIPAGDTETSPDDREAAPASG
jgi:glycosyltransferase involved in cell wall biosynthesis